MNASRSNRRQRRTLVLVAVVAAVLGSAGALAQSAAPTAPPTIATAEPATPHAVAFWPDLGGTVLAWFAAVVILTLTFTLRPLFSWRNLDGLLLAGTGLLLARRLDTTAAFGGHTCQWWSYLGLTIVAAYWLVRGVGLLLATRVSRPAGVLPTGATIVLLVAGLVICAQHIASAPISAGAADGAIGGLYTSETGKLPYGDTPGRDGRAPLLYAVYAAAARLAEPTIALGNDAVPDGFRWPSRETWLHESESTGYDLAAERLVNTVLFLGTLLGLYVIGRRLQNGAAALVLLAIFCVFPGTLECLSRPEIMLPAMLLTWTLAFALLPGVGGFLATLCLVLAGVAWPWAWLGLPVLLGYFWRRGWHALGATVGVLGGAALIVYGLLQFVQPTIPRASGALLAAGRQPTWSVHLAQDGTLMPVRRDAVAEIESPSLTKPLWRLLVTLGARPVENSTSGQPQIDWPKSAGDAPVFYHEFEPDADALPILTARYRAAMAEATATARLAAAARTVLEATWFPMQASPAAVPSTWTQWGGASGAQAGGIVTLRRIVKVVAGLLALWAALAIFFGRRTRPRQLAGGLLIVAAGTLLASSAGAVANLVWLLPLVLVLWVVHEESPVPAAAAPAAERRPPPAFEALAYPRGPEPRITTEAPKPIKLADEPAGETSKPPSEPDQPTGQS